MDTYTCTHVHVTVHTYTLTYAHTDAYMYPITTHAHVHTWETSGATALVANAAAAGVPPLCTVGRGELGHRVLGVGRPGVGIRWWDEQR